MDEYLLVANASAGSAEHAELEKALAVLRAAGPVEAVATAHADELDEVVAALDDRVLVAAGGDGTLHAVVNALHRADRLGTTRVGLVPVGTGNDFARTIDLPLDAAQAAAVVVAGRTVPTDLIVDDLGMVVVNNVHLGVGAQASREATVWKPRLGRLGYAVGALSAGLRPRFLHVSVTVDGRPVIVRHRVAQVAVGNGSRVGGGTELIPGAHPGDGRLVVIVSRAARWWRRVAYLARLRGGTHHLMREVTRVRGTEVVVEGEAFWLVADGEISGPCRSRSWRVLPGAMSLFHPV